MKPELNTLLLLEDKEARNSELERWKDEALTALGQWSSLFEALPKEHTQSPKYLGRSQYIVVGAFLMKLKTENARLAESKRALWSGLHSMIELLDRCVIDETPRDFTETLNFAKQALADHPGDATILVEEDANPTPHQICRWEKFGDEWKLLVEDRGHAASVWDNGTWHTWDRNGVGGENFIEKTVLRAKIEAAASAIAQGFI